MTEFDIEDKADELLKGYMADDSYLGDALVDCYAEVRLLANAVTLDDKLNCLDAFLEKLKESVRSPELLRVEAAEILEAQEADDWIEIASRSGWHARAA